MRKLILAAGVAALAIAMPAAAKPGGGHGNGGGQGGAQKAERGGGNGGQARAQRGGGGHGGERAFISQRGGGGRSFAMERRGGGGGARFASFQTERGHGGGKPQRIETRGGGHRSAMRVENRGRGGEERLAVQQQQGRGGQRLEVQHGRGGEQRLAVNGGNWRAQKREMPQVRDERVVTTRGWDDDHWNRIFVDRGIPAGFVGGCPPGLAKKTPACVPPGLARTEFVGRALPTVYSSNYIPQSLRYIYGDTPDYYYRYGDGYAYRVNRSNNLVSALLPLIGAGYGVGEPFPYMADPYYYVPNYYQSFYPDTPYDYYRYDNGYVYRIDAGTGFVEDVIPLLDRGYGVGQMLPVSYSYYNVPYQYRSLYYDTPDYYYRYAPGAIYQVDRNTQLITALASLLTGGLSVGQPLPPAYSVYNVPMSYRDMYYDTPDSWYRYSDGYIYQVDPTTQLITAIVRAIV